MLTKEEKIEREILIELRCNNQRWLSQDEFDRLKELSERMYQYAGDPHCSKN